MDKDDSVYLRPILDAINTVEEYLQGVDEERFKATLLPFRTAASLRGCFAMAGGARDDMWATLTRS